MRSGTSQFYPPRARGFGRLRAVTFALKRLLYVCPIPLPERAAVYGIIIPGYGLRVLGYRMLSLLTLAAYAIAALIFFSTLGFRGANYALAFMIALHAVTAVYATRHVIVHAEFLPRIRTSALILTLLILCYFLLERGLDQVITPLRYSENVYVVNRLASGKNVRRGERIAYRIDGAGESFENGGHGAVIVRAGFGFGDVLAVAGDTIEFTSDAVLINGVQHPRRPQMPDSGTVVVPRNNWFIWPDFAISMQGEAAAIEAREMVARMGMVNGNHFVGTIFRHWFWRKQQL